MNTGYTYKFNSGSDSVTVSGLSDFIPAQTFLCGQCFRWEQEADGSFTGVAFSKAVNIKQENNSITISNCSPDDFSGIWKRYLDLDTDYTKIKSALAVDEHLKKASAFGGGIRILNQEPFECLISFIISTQNNIPRIKKIINELCRLYGNRISLGGKDFYSFPDCHTLASLGEGDLASLNAGYRVPYILDAAGKVASGEIELEKLFSMPTGRAREELMKIKGVGPKVADCVLLFSLQKGDSFPVDVWMQKIMRSLYLDEKASLKQIRDFGTEKFGALSGIAQQYLFFYARENG